MARDLDFNRRRASAPPPSSQKAPTNAPAKTVIKPLPSSVVSPERLKKKPKLPTWLWLIVILLLIAWGVFFYLVSIRPAKVSNQPAKQTAATVSTKSALLAGQTSTDTEITLYNSGAGAEAVTALATTLKGAGFDSQDLGDSQFQLDQTYIWYQKDYASQVEEIKNLLGDRKIALRPYAGASPYKILIQLGPK